MNLLLDTNIFLEVILEQERVHEARTLLSKVEEHEFFISDYSLHSIGLLLFRREKPEVFRQFLKDMILGVGVVVITLPPPVMERLIEVAQRFGLDFDDAYQYAVRSTTGLPLSASTGTSIARKGAARRQRTCLHDGREVA
jgi:predicted nucleic acid-binding protein